MAVFTVIKNNQMKGPTPRHLHSRKVRADDAGEVCVRALLGKPLVDSCLVFCLKIHGLLQYKTSKRYPRHISRIYSGCQESVFFPFFHSHSYGHRLSTGASEYLKCIIAEFEQHQTFITRHHDTDTRHGRLPSWEPESLWRP